MNYIHFVGRYLFGYNLFSQEIKNCQVDKDDAVLGSGQHGGTLQYGLQQFFLTQTVDQPPGRFMQDSQIIVLPAQGFFSLFDLANFSFKLPGTMLQLLIGFFPGF